MGLLPDSWAGRKITQRTPYNMAGELTLTGAQTGMPFPEATFTQNIDQPFEVHRMKPGVTGLNGGGNVVAVQPDQRTLLALVRLKIDRVGGVITLTKAPTLASSLVKGSAELTWEFGYPDTIVRQEGYEVNVTTLATPVFADPITSLRIEVIFQGYLLQLGPPSEQR